MCTTGTAAACPRRRRRMMAGYRVGRRNTRARPHRRAEDIMQELRTQGSVQAVMEVHQDLFLYQAGVYTTNTGPILGHHAVRQSGALSLVQISQDAGLSLVEPYYAGAKVCAITTHLNLVPFSVLLWHDKRLR